MATQVIKANRISKKQTGEVHFVVSPRDLPACSVAGTIDDDGNLTDVHCVNNSCDGECQLHSDPEGDTINYYCTC